MNCNVTLGDEIAALAAQLEAGEYRLITKIGEFDAQGGYAREGALSCAHWLSYRVGLGLGPAREKVRVARVLPKLPLIAQAFEAARVSYSKVRAITRVATPENEALLVDLATSAPASVLETLCRRFRGVARAERETPEEADERRKVVVHHTDDGRLRLSVELDADEGARLLAALELARFDVSAETPSTFDVSAETPPTRADALMVLVESFLAEGARSRKGGSPTEVRLHVTEDELDGWTAARPSSTTSSCSAGGTIPSCMSMGIGSSGMPRALSSLRPAGGPYPRGLRSPSHRVRRSSASPRRTRTSGCRSARCR